MYHDVLLPTDGSDGSERAVEHALELAAEHDATLHVLYVVDAGGMGFAATPDDVAETKERLRERGRRVTESVADRARSAGVDFRTKVDAGVPFETILEYLDEHDVDLVVMGRRGALDPDRHLLGSTTDRVLARASVPVQAV